VPPTVQAVIAARIDRLEENTKRVLEIASVVGREISISILEFVSGSAQGALAEEIQHLRRAELLYDVPPFEQRLLAFRHPLIQEVAYRSLLHERRRELHSKVAQAIESLFQGPCRGACIAVAYHLEQSGENLKAAQQNMRAAVWIGANDPSQAFAKLAEGARAAFRSTVVDADRLSADMACGQIVNLAGVREFRRRTPASTSTKPGIGDGWETSGPTR